MIHRAHSQTHRKQAAVTILIVRLFSLLCRLGYILSPSLNVCQKSSSNSDNNSSKKHHHEPPHRNASLTNNIPCVRYTHTYVETIGNITPKLKKIKQQQKLEMEHPGVAVVADSVTARGFCNSVKLLSSILATYI